MQNKEKEEQLKQTNSFSYSKELKQKSREEIIKNFGKEIDKKKEKSEYNEEKQHSYEIKEKLELYKRKEKTSIDNPNNEKPGILISSRVSKTSKNLLETREIKINDENIKYIISTTKGGKGIVNDCQVIDSFKINDTEIIKKFIDTVVFSYPDLVNNREIKHKEGKAREQEIKESFFWEWLAHNWMYNLFMFGDTSKEMTNEKIKNSPFYKYMFLHKLLYKLRDKARTVNLDNENLMRQKLYELMGHVYLKKINKLKKKKK